MDTPLRFLVIDDNADSRALLTRTLARRYPAARIHECHEASVALALAKRETWHAIVTHRTFEFDGLELVRRLRAANRIAPILMVSGLDRSKEAFAAGATRFLNYDEWLRVGKVMHELLTDTRSPFSPDRAADDSPEHQPA